MRNISIDCMKVILAYFVIMLHMQFLSQDFATLSFILVNGIFRLSVPLFIIISGFYFFNIKNKEIFLKWISRIGVLYIIWMLIYSPFWINSNILITLINIITGYFILWYLIGVLISGCILYLIKEKLSLIQAFIFSITIFSIGYIIQEVGNAHIFSDTIDKIINFTPITRNFFFFCLPFLYVGYLINKFSLHSKVTISFKIVLISVLLVLIESYLNYIFISKSEPLDLLLSLFIATPIIFIYFLKKEIKKFSISKYLPHFSTGLFLIHPLVIKLLKEIDNVYLFYILVLILSSILSIILVIFNKKVKYLL